MKQLANMSTEPRIGASQNNAENVINQTLHFIMYSQKKASRIFSNYHCRPKWTLQIRFQSRPLKFTATNYKLHYILVCNLGSDSH